MAIDAFLYFTGGVKITATTQDATFASKNAMEIESVHFGQHQTLNIGSQSSGSGAGKVSFDAFTIIKPVDNNSPQFFQALCSGVPFTTATIAMRKSAGGGTTATGGIFLQYDFKLVALSDIVTSYDTSSETAVETISFGFGGMQITYKVQNNDGSLGASNVASWNRITNTNTLG